jgi:hypothetical protein
MATTAAVILGFAQGIALLRRIKKVVQKLRGGSAKRIDIDSIRRDMGK